MMQEHSGVSASGVDPSGNGQPQNNPRELIRDHIALLEARAGELSGQLATVKAELGEYRTALSALEEKPKKKRPPRADIGFRQDLENAAEQLQRHVILQSRERNANRTDVIAQATCAVARALEDIDCGKVPRRDHFGSSSARIFDAALQGALYKGVAAHYIKNNVRHLPDQLLELGYLEYRRQNRLEDDGRS